MTMRDAQCPMGASVRVVRHIEPKAAIPTRQTSRPRNGIAIRQRGTVPLAATNWARVAPMAIASQMLKFVTPAFAGDQGGLLVILITGPIIRVAGFPLAWE